MRKRMVVRRGVMRGGVLERVDGCNRGFERPIKGYVEHRE